MKQNKPFKLWLLALILLAGSGVMWGQTPYLMSGGDYSEQFTNIANTTNWPDNFNGTDCVEWRSVAVNSTGTLGDGVKTTVSTATFTTSTSGGVQRGSANIYMLSTSTNNSCAIDLLLDFTGRTAGTISFEVATVFNSTGNRDSKLKLFYSIDGTSFTEITGTNLPYTARNNVAGSASISNINLPAVFNNCATARLRFYEYSTTAGGTTPAGSQPKISIDNISVTSTAAAAATKLAITSISPTTPTSGSTFNVTVQAQDGSGNAGSVTSATAISLTNTGGGTIGGTTTGTISAGGSSVTISGVTLSTSGTGVTLTATRTSGDDLTAGTSSAFNVLAAAPTTASVVTVGTKTATTIPLSWTNGNGTARIVVARLNSTTAVAPTAGTAYTANSASFTDGANSTTGTNNVVIYNGTGNTVTVTGLTAATAYNFDVYEYNGTTSTYNYAAAASAGSTTTLDIEPTAQATALTFTNVTTTGMTIGWTKPSSGGGTYSLVVVKSGSEVNSDPTDGTFYGASTAFGSGNQTGTGNYVVYNSTGSSISISGLTSNTTYYVAVYQYNGTSTACNYFTTSPLTGNRTTPPTSATNMVTGLRTGTSINVSWTNGNGTGRIVVARLSTISAVAPTNGTTYTPNSTDFTDTQNPKTGTGNVVIYNGTGSAAGAIGLTASTNYRFDVYEYTGSNYSAVLTSGAISTLAAEPTLQTTNVTFTAILADRFTINFTKGDGDNRIVLVKSGSAVDAIPVDATTYTASTTFSSGEQIGTGNRVVYNGTGVNVTVTGLTANTTYYVAVFEFKGTGGNTNYLTSSPATGSQITLVAAPSAPTNLTFGSVTYNSFTASFTAPGTPPDGYLVVRRKGAAVNGDPVGGTEYTVDQYTGNTALNDIIYVGTSPWTNENQTGLTDNTTYYYAVYSYAGSGTQINYSTALTGSQTTAVIPATTANAASSISETGFTANWDVSSNASGGYLLDVSTSETFSTSTPANLNEGFETGLSSSGYYNQTATLSSGDWIFVDGGLRNTDKYAGTYSCQLKASTGTATTPSMSNVGTVTFYAKASASSTNLIIKKIVSGGTPSTVETKALTTSWAQYTVAVNDNNSDIKLVFACGANYTLIDAVSIGYTTFTPSFVTGYNAKPITGQSTISSDVTGLSPNTPYYYRVRAKSANSTSANSNTVTAFTAFANGTTNASTLPDCATCDIVVNNGGELNVNATKTYNKVTVKAGGKLTLASGSTLTAPITIESDATNGTGTYVDENLYSGSIPAITATVNQAVTNLPRTYYTGIPVAVSSTTGIDKVATFSESADAWSALSDPGSTTMPTPGQGYLIQVFAAVSPSPEKTHISFTGTLNTGDKGPIALTVDKKKFNFLGNPYPSYLDGQKVVDASTLVEKSIWFRGKDGSAYQFSTYNTPLGIWIPASASVTPNATNNGFIPPMQGFWLKATSAGNYTFTNAMRTHNTTGSAIPLKAPQAAVNQILRLQVSNGTALDETVVLFNENATTGYDSYDASKMMNTGTGALNIYTKPATENLVLNSMPAIVYDMEIPVGMKLAAGTYTVSANEFSNFAEGTKVQLIDKLTGAVTNLNEGTYEFTLTEAMDNATRFALEFPRYNVATGIGNGNSDAVYVFAGNNRIVVNTAEIPQGTIMQVYNSVGQCLTTQAVNGSVNEIKGQFTPGVYLVKVNNVTAKVVMK